MSHTTTRAVEQNDRAGASLQWILFALGAGAVLSHALFTFFFPENVYPPSLFGRTWGFHFIAYFPHWTRIAFYAVGLAVAVPWVSAALVRGIRTLLSPDRVAIMRSRKTELFITLSIASVALFWILSSRYALLGDSHLRVGNVVRRDFLVDELGTIYVMHYFYLLANKLLHFDGVAAFIAFSCLSGGVFVYLALLIADTLAHGFFRKAAFFTFVVAFGTIQHFFGYIEIYALSIVLLTGYVYASLLVLRGRSPIVVPGVLLAAAIFCHLISAMFAPSFAVLLYIAVLRKYPLFKKPWFIVLLLAVAAAAAWGPFVKFVYPRMYPLSAVPEGRMTLFSAARIWEFMNGQILAFGIALFLLVACTLLALRHRRAIDTTAVVLGAAWILPFCGIFMFDEVFGSADWDLYSFASIAGQPLALYLFLRMADPTPWRRLVPQALVGLCVFMGLHTAPWILVNATHRSVARFRDIILTDPATYFISHPAPMFLGIVLETNGLQQESLEMHRRAFEMYPKDPRMIGNYANRLLQTQQTAKAMELYQRLFNEFPQYTHALKTIYRVMEQSGKKELATTVLQRLYEVYRTTPAAVTAFYEPQELVGYLSAYCQKLIDARQLNAALPVCSTIVAINPSDNQSRYLLAAIHMDLGHADQAFTLVQPLLTQSGAPSAVPLLASQAAERKGNIPLAMSLLRECVLATSDQQVRKQAQVQLDRLTSAPGGRR